jgi:hypothetical protein
MRRPIAAPARRQPRRGEGEQLARRAWRHLEARQRPPFACQTRADLGGLPISARRLLVDAWRCPFLIARHPARPLGASRRGRTGMDRRASAKIDVIHHRSCLDRADDSAQTAAGALPVRSCEGHPPTVSGAAVVRRPPRRRRLLPDCSSFWQCGDGSGREIRAAAGPASWPASCRRRVCATEDGLALGRQPFLGPARREPTAPRGGSNTPAARGTPAPRPPVRLRRGPNPCPAWGCGLCHGMGAARHDGGASCREAVEEGRPVARPPVQSSGAPPRVGTAARRPSLRDRPWLLAGRPGLPA